MTKSKLIPMTVVTLKVVRKTEFGVFLDAETGKTADDILLHKTQQISEVKIGDKVEVFLYLDPQKRLTASMHLPKIREGQIARLKIINITNDGAFVDAGAERGIFMPFREMIGRPEVGDVIWAKLYTDKSGRLAMSMHVSDEMRRAAKPAVDIKRGDKVNGSIFNIIDAGAFMISENHNIIFISKKEIPHQLKIGEEVTARVTFVHEDGRVNASLRDQKEKTFSKDAETIFNYMKKNGDRINENVSPDFIYKNFHMSKAAFKRAVGHLYKERKIQRDKYGFVIKF